MKNCISFLLFILCCLLVHGPAGAKADAMEEASKTELEKIVVTAARVEEPAAEVNANAIILDEKEIQMSPARDLGGLLSELNIGHIEKTPGNQTSVGIRGFRSSATGSDLQGRVLILLNGRRAGTGNVAKIMTENIERIEIIRGPASVQYGSAALGGVVNVITKQGKGEPKFFAKGKLGSFGYESAGAGISGKISGFDFSGSFSRSTMDDYDTGSDEGYDNTGYDEKENISLNLGYEFLPNNRIGVIYTGFDANEVGSPNQLMINDPNNYVDTSNESVDFVYDGSTRDGLFSWKARYYNGEDEYEYINISDPGASFDSYYTSETDTDHEGAQAQMSWNPGQYTLTVGVDWIKYEIEQNFAPNETEYDNPSYFLLGKARYLDDRLVITGGLRYDDYEVEVKGGQGDKKDDDNVSPKVGASFFLLENLKLRANYGEGFRMPSAAELAGDYSAFGVPYQGNPNLDPEKSDTYELAVDWYHQLCAASLTYFYTDFEDKIDTNRAGNITTWENLGEATVSGFEGNFFLYLGKWLQSDWQIKPYVHFTYLDTYEDEENDKDLKYTSDLLLSCGLSVSDFEGFSARINLAYTGEQDIDYFDPLTYDATRMEKGGFTVANLSFQKKVFGFNEIGELYVDGAVHNLFDKDYSYVEGYPMPGRSFEMGLEYKY